MTTKEIIYNLIGDSGKHGITVPEFLDLFPNRLPQTVYPCFTQLCKAKKILDSRERRKSKNNRRSIVWVDAKYGGTIPVWGSGQPSYSYKNRAKVIMDLLSEYGPLSVSEMMTSSDTLKPMSTSSLVSRLVKQQWLRKTNRTRLNRINQTCCLYDLTPRGKQVRDSSPKKDKDLHLLRASLRTDTEKTRG
ncbi:hypothetical protein LCGC14_0330300 [marine sediment metagenome]|uniref:Uncharacterized protein n=1 Tax=marine sediment metagenome TaxID=412755 RepID=A0A0F9TZK4_9ZZZZ